MAVRKAAVASRPAGRMTYRKTSLFFRDSHSVKGFRIIRRFWWSGRFAVRFASLSLKLFALPAARFQLALRIDAGAVETTHGPLRFFQSKRHTKARSIHAAYIQKVRLKGSN